MKSKKNTTDNRPVSRKKIDVTLIKHNAATQMVTYTWLCLLGALIDFPDTTKENIIRLWREVSDLSEKQAATTIGRIPNHELRKIEQDVGLRPVNIPDFDNIRTQKDLNRFIRKVNDKAMQTTLAIIVRPLLQNNYSVEFIRRLIEKTYGINDSICSKQMALHEINDALAEEYNLVLYNKDGAACLAEIMPPA